MGSAGPLVTVAAGLGLVLHSAPRYAMCSVVDSEQPLLQNLSLHVKVSQKYHTGGRGPFSLGHPSPCTCWRAQLCSGPFRTHSL